MGRGKRIKIRGVGNFFASSTRKMIDSHRIANICAFFKTFTQKTGQGCFFFVMLACTVTTNSLATMNRMQKNNAFLRIMDTQPETQTFLRNTVHCTGCIGGYVISQVIHRIRSEITCHANPNLYTWHGQVRLTVSIRHKFWTLFCWHPPPFEPGQVGAMVIRPSDGIACIACIAVSLAAWAQDISLQLRDSKSIRQKLCQNYSGQEIRKTARAHSSSKRPW